MMDGIKLFWFSSILVSMTTAGVHSDPVDNGQRTVTKLEFVGEANKSTPIRTRAASPGDVVITGDVTNQVIYNIDKPSFNCQDGERNCNAADPGPHPLPVNPKDPVETDPPYNPNNPEDPKRPKHPLPDNPPDPVGTDPPYNPNNPEDPKRPKHPLPDSPSHPGEPHTPYVPKNPVDDPNGKHPLPRNKTQPECDPMNCTGTSCCQTTNANGMEGGVINSGKIDSQFIVNVDNKVSPQFIVYFEPYNGSVKMNGAKGVHFESRSLSENTDKDEYNKRELPKSAMPTALEETDVPTDIPEAFASIETSEPTIAIETSEPTVTTEIPEPVIPTENPKQAISSNKALLRRNKNKPEKSLKPKRAKRPMPVILYEVSDYYDRNNPRITRTKRPLRKRLHKPNRLKRLSKKKAQNLHKYMNRVRFLD